jgi:glycosyltransferase involved in cell wall biosynthesis
MDKKTIPVAYVMKVLLLDPFHTGSHAHWSKALKAHLDKRGKVHIEIRTLAGRHWKWRMNGSAAAFASSIAADDPLPDAILTTDMMDVAAFRGLLPIKWRMVKIIQYFHENQLTYPWNPSDPDARNGQNRTYGFLNIQSALAADIIWFNSNYHRMKFLEAAELFLSQMPDHTLPHVRENIGSKSAHLPIGISDQHEKEKNLKSTKVKNEPVLLWNHRWEYDKAPDRFFETLTNLKEQNYRFQLLLLGQQFDRMPEAWDLIKTNFESQIIFSGWADTLDEYHFWLRQADFVIHSPRQEYFGISILEAMCAGVIPLVSKGHAYDDWMPDKFILNPNRDISQQLHHLGNTMHQNQSEAISIAKTFDWEIVSKKYETALLSI